MKCVVLVLNKMISRTSLYCRFVRHSQSPWQKQNNFFSRNLNKKKHVWPIPNGKIRSPEWVYFNNKKQAQPEGQVIIEEKNRLKNSTSLLCPETDFWINY